MIEVWDPNEPKWTGNSPQWLSWDGREQQTIWDDDTTAPRNLRWRRTSDRPSHFTVLLTPEEADWLQELLRGTLVEPDEVMERKILGALEVATDPARALAE